MHTWTRRLLVALAAVVALLATAIALAWKSDLPLDELKARWATGTSRFVDVDGMTVHYRDEGNGPPIVLLHGAGASLHTWDAWAGALSRSRRVVRLDLPGFGLTGPQPQSDYRMGTYVAFLDHFAARLRLGRFALAGNSFGGTLAWRFATTHPSEVSDLILVDAGGFSRPAKRPLVFRLGQMPVVSALMPHLDPRPLVEHTTRLAYGDPTRLSPEVVERYYEMTLRPGNRAAFGAMTSVPYEDHTAELAGFHALAHPLGREGLAPSPRRRVALRTEHSRRGPAHLPRARACADGGRRSANGRRCKRVSRGVRRGVGAGWQRSLTGIAASFAWVDEPATGADATPRPT